MTQIKRSVGQSAVAAAAYRAGEKLHSAYYGEDSDYTRKGGVICSEILLPSHAPPEYADRETLWNAVEKAERGKKAQLAYSFDIALQNEFSMQENIDLARQSQPLHQLLHHLPENLRRVTEICVGFRHDSENERSAESLEISRLGGF